MYAIIETGGKQYKVQQGDEIYIEKLAFGEGDQVTFEALAYSNGEGLNFDAKATVTGKVERHGKGKKLTVFKYKPKKNYRRKQGHRQPYTKVTIEKIEA